MMDDLHINLLLREIIINPDDDTVRLAYADALEERGRGLDADWASNIRLMIRWKANDFYDGSPDIKDNILANLLISKLKGTILAKVGENKYTAFSGDWDFWRRGFIEEVHLDLFVKWERLAEILYWNPTGGKECPPTAHPIRKVYQWDKSGTPQSPRVYESPLYPGIVFERRT